jgi:dipeptidyl aminopeptidase/acylaminoacyl peptidase
MKRIFSFCLVLLSITVHAQKKPLDHSVYDQWQSIKDVVLSNDGNWMSYTITPQEGDGSLIIQHLKNNQRFKIDRGTAVQFTENNSFLIAKIKPTFNETRQAKISKKKPEEMPKDSLLIIDLVSNEIKKIASVKSFQLAEHNSKVLIYLKDKKGDITKEGADLVVYDLQNKTDRSFNNVAQYQLQPYGESVALFQIKSKTAPAKVLLASTTDTLIKTLSSAVFSASNLTWDEQGKQLAYLIEKDSTHKALQKDFSLAYYTDQSDTAKHVFDRKHIVMPGQYTIGGDKKLNFSKSGASLSFGIQPILPIKDTSLPEFDRVSVDIWNYTDANLQSTQLKSVEASLKSTEAVQFKPALNQFTYLGKINDRQIQYTAEGDGQVAIANVDSNYTIASQWQGYGNRDLYMINTITGQKQLIQKALKGNLVTPSYDGSLIVFYDEVAKQFKSYNTATLQTKQIAKDIKFPLYDEDNDVPDDPNAYGIAMWMDNNKSFILYDRYDLWLVDASGLNASQLLTKGRATKNVYRLVNLKEDKKFIGFKDQLLLRSFNENDKSEGIALFDMGNRTLFTITEKPMHFTTIFGSKNTIDFIAMQEDEKNAPNLFHYTLSQVKQTSTALASINTQQADYNWMQSQLVRWKAYTGKTAEGILYLPEDFDAKKKYPMIVYFYERNNQTLHNYLPPSPTPSRLNIPFFVSRGYVVFVPDIWYQKGYPGQGAYDYIVSGTKAMVQKGFIDSTRIGLQGQSWGGYQIAYLITKTNMYAAAWAGAPVVNMTSAYGGIRWGAGINRQFQYEKTQSRIGANLWERPDLYIKNSPLFELNKVKTPIVIMSNDADDAVPWYQGIEMFTAMRRLAKPIWMLVYNNEAHNLVERKNRKDIQIREQQFFDHYLKDAPMPIWMSKGVPAIMKGRDLGLGL